MIRLFSFLVLTLMISVSAVAQKGSVGSADYELTAEKPNYNKAKEKIDAAEKNEKTMNWPKTYVVKSKVYRSMYVVSREKDEKNPKSELIMTAYDALKKAEELDKKGDAKGKGKGKFQKDVELEFLGVRTEMINDGVAAYNRGNSALKADDQTGGEKAYKEALTSFGNVLSLDKMDAATREYVDTVIMFNAAISAYYSKSHDEAIKYLEQLKDMGYSEETPYLMLYTEYRDVKDTVNMVNILKEGFLKHPEVEVFIKDLVVYFINNDKMEEGMDYIDKALERDPTNSGFWYAKGTFLDKKDDIEGALKCYNNALQHTKSDEDKYNINYNIGVIFYNAAVEKFEIANEIQDYKKYKEATAVAYEAMRKVVPYFEACAELKPDDMQTLNTLSSVYYRLSKDDPEMSKKYTTVQAKVDAMKK